MDGVLNALNGLFGYIRYEVDARQQALAEY